jgi:hypothetical protein
MKVCVYVLTRAKCLSRMTEQGKQAWVRKNTKLLLPKLQSWLHSCPGLACWDAVPLKAQVCPNASSTISGAQKQY